MKKNKNNTEEEIKTKEEKDNTKEETNENSESIESTTEPIDTNKEEIAKLKDMLLRQMAEYDNYRKRTIKERADLTADITGKTVLEFLPIIDNIERAVASETSDENYKKGIEMINSSISGILTKLGVEAINSDNQLFDPNLHRAVSKIDAEGVEPDYIVATYEKGYKMGEKIIRYATVVVAN